MEFLGMRKALHRHQTQRKKEGKNAVNPSSVTLNPVALREYFTAIFHLCNPLNDTFSPHCALSFLLLLPQKAGIERIFNGCFLSMTLSPLNASFRFGSSFELCVMLVLLFTGRKSLCFQHCFLHGANILQSDKSILLLFPSMLAKDCWTIPVEAAKKLEVPKSVEMSKEAVWKSVLVESLKHSVIPTTDIDGALERDILIWRISGGYKKWRLHEWGQGNVKK